MQKPRENQEANFHFSQEEKAQGGIEAQVSLNPGWPFSDFPSWDLAL